MFEGIILKCDSHASMLCLSGLVFFLFFQTHSTYCMKRGGLGYSARRSDECTLPRNPMSRWRDEVCLFFLERSSLALVWFLETCMHNKCYFDQPLSRRRTSPTWLRSGRKWPPGSAGTHVSLILRLPLGVCCHSPSFQPRQIAARVPAGPSAVWRRINCQT